MTPILYTIADESPKLSKLIESEYDKYKWVNDYRLGNKEIYKVISEFEVARDANQAIENELKKIINKKHFEFGALGAFISFPQSSSCHYHLVIIKKIRALYPNHEITCVVDSILTHFFLKTIFKNKKWLKIKLLKKHNAEYVFYKFPRFILPFIFLPLKSLGVFKNWLKVKRSPSQHLLGGGPVFLSPSEKLFQNFDGMVIDYVFLDVYKQMTCDNELIITWEEKGHKSYFSCLNFLQMLICIWVSILDWVRLFFALPKQYRYYMYAFFNALIMMNGLTLIFKKIKPKCIFYQDEVFSEGRLAALVSSGLKIDSIGVQHALIAPIHPTYLFFRKYKSFPQLLPNKMIVYGNETTKLLESWEYPKNQVFEIGCSRIFKKNEPVNEFKKHDVLFLSPINFYEFNRLYHNFEGKRIAIRPHPLRFEVFSYDRMTKNDFKIKFPEVEIIESNNESINESINHAEIIFSTWPSTAFLNAILSKKVCILYTTEALGDSANLGIWGVQVVTHFNQIDWEKRADPAKLQEELAPKRVSLGNT